MNILNCMKTYKIKSYSDAWFAKELTQRDNFIYRFTPQDIDTLQLLLTEGMRDLETSSLESLLDSSYLSNFIKSSLGHQLESGTGVILLKGLSISNFSETQLSDSFVFISRLFGNIIPQGPSQQMTCRIEDLQLADKSKSRGFNTNSDFFFHNDSCDFTGMLCVRPAKYGGLSKIISSVAIHNTMLDFYPDLLRVLYNPFPIKCLNMETGSKVSYAMRPIFHPYNNSIICNFARPAINATQHLESCPKLTSMQIEALDVFEDLIENPKFCHSFLLESGDVLFLNNHRCLHSRTSFIDDPNRKRLLLRAWLSAKSYIDLPNVYKIKFSGARKTMSKLE